MLKLSKDSPVFTLPKGLVRQGNFLVWRPHPWLQSSRPTENLSWGAIFPRAGPERTALAKVSPESFLVYEIIPKKTWGLNVYQVAPKFPITQGITKSAQKPNLKINTRGLLAAYRRARQHAKKYGELSKLVQQLRAKYDAKSKSKSTKSSTSRSRSRSTKSTKSKSRSTKKKSKSTEKRITKKSTKNKKKSTVKASRRSTPPKSGFADRMNMDSGVSVATRPRSTSTKPAPKLSKAQREHAEQKWYSTVG